MRLWRVEQTHVHAFGSWMCIKRVSALFCIAKSMNLEAQTEFATTEPPKCIQSSQEHGRKYPFGRKTLKPGYTASKSWEVSTVKVPLLCEWWRSTKSAPRPAIGSLCAGTPWALMSVDAMVAMEMVIKRIQFLKMIWLDELAAYC